MKKIILGISAFALFGGALFGITLGEYKSSSTSTQSSNHVSSNHSSQQTKGSDEKNALANYGKADHHTRVNKPKHRRGHRGYGHGYHRPPIYVRPIAPAPLLPRYPHYTGSIISKIKKLNLSRYQREEIRDIVEDYNDNKVSHYNIFSNGHFNRYNFIKQSKKRLEKKADMIEDIYYDVLNSRQRRRLDRML